MPLPERSAALPPAATATAPELLCPAARHDRSG
jgi:hypothetical protein